MNVLFADRARKEFLKLDRPVQQQIQKFILKLKDLENPRTSGNALAGIYAGLWRYRVGDYRLVCEIKDEGILITVLRIAHRKEVYF